MRRRCPVTGASECRKRSPWQRTLKQGNCRPRR